MRSFSKVSSVALLVLVVACGGTVDDVGNTNPSGSAGTSAAGHDGVAGSGGSTVVITAGAAGATTSAGAAGATTSAGAAGATTGAPTIIGSYDLTFTAATATSDFDPIPGQPASLTNTNARLDVRAKDGGGYEAAFTSANGIVDALAVEDDGAKITLTGAGDVRASFVTDTWASLVFPLAANGSFAGTFTAAGNVQATSGDQIFDGALTGGGTIGADVTVPIVTVTTGSPDGPPMAALPWDAIAIRASEPLPLAALTASTHVTTTFGEGAPTTRATTASLDGNGPIGLESR